MKTLRIKTLEKGWCDRTEVLLHAAFQILVDFMEQEEPDKHVDWKGTSPTHGRAWKEIQRLYKWWTTIRPKRYERLSALIGDMPDVEHRPTVLNGRKTFELVFSKEFSRQATKVNAFEQKLDAEDQRNLHRLIEVRGHLWT